MCCNLKRIHERHEKNGAKRANEWHELKRIVKPHTALSTEDTEEPGKGSMLAVRPRVPANVQIAKFLLCIVPLSLGLEVLWETQIAPHVYDCTDQVGFDYLIPGGWVHGKIATVPHVVHGRSMSEPDTVKEGWSEPRLWMLWLACFGGSVTLSLTLARTHWIPLRLEHLLFEPQEAARFSAT